MPRASTPIAAGISAGASGATSTPCGGGHLGAGGYLPATDETYSATASASWPVTMFAGIAPVPAPPFSIALARAPCRASARRGSARSCRDVPASESVWQVPQDWVKICLPSADALAPPPPPPPAGLGARLLGRLVAAAALAGRPRPLRRRPIARWCCRRSRAPGCRGRRRPRSPRTPARPWVHGAGGARPRRGRGRSAQGRAVRPRPRHYATRRGGDPAGTAVDGSRRLAWGRCGSQSSSPMPAWPHAGMPSGS